MKDSSLVCVDHVVDAVLEQGAKHLYDQYLKPKILPYAAKRVTMTSIIPAEVSYKITDLLKG